MNALDERLRREVRDSLPDLPNWDRPCEKRVMEYIPPNMNSPYGSRDVHDCGKEPTFILQKRHRVRGKVHPERKFYCAFHTIEASGALEPVRGNRG